MLFGVPGNFENEAPVCTGAPLSRCGPRFSRFFAFLRLFSFLSVFGLHSGGLLGALAPPDRAKKDAKTKKTFVRPEVRPPWLFWRPFERLLKTFRRPFEIFVCIFSEDWVNLH